MRAESMILDGLLEPRVNKRRWERPMHLVAVDESEKTACGIDALGQRKSANPELTTCKNCLRHVRSIVREETFKWKTFGYC